MSDPSRILVAIDFSKGSLTALARAQSLTKSTGDSLVACAVFEGQPDDKLIREAEHRLTDLAPEAEVQVRSGTPFVELIQAARAADARLIMAGATGEHTTGQLALGVTVDRLARKADRPVLVVRRHPQDGYRSVIVGIDGSSDATHAAHLARRLAPGAQITAVLAAPPIGEHLLTMRGIRENDLSAYRNRLQENARELLAKVASDLPLDEQEAVVGRAEAVLLEAASRREADLIAIGRRGTSALAAVLLGRVSHHVVHEAPCDVLVYGSRHIEFQLP